MLWADIAQHNHAAFKVYEIPVSYPWKYLWMSKIKRM